MQKSSIKEITVKGGEQCRRGGSVGKGYHGFLIEG